MRKEARRKKEEERELQPCFSFSSFVRASPAFEAPEKEKKKKKDGTVIIWAKKVFLLLLSKELHLEICPSSSFFAFLRG